MTTTRESVSQRRVREAADRAYWHLQRAGGGERQEPQVGSTDPSWYPTVAECRFMDRDEVQSCWSTAVRGAARAVFPKKTVALRHAAHLGAFLVVTDRLSEARVNEHLRRAAKAAGVGPQETERVIHDGYVSGQAHAFGQIDRGGVEGDHPGAFTAVAAASDQYDIRLKMFIDPGGLLPLPPAVLVHRGHNPKSLPVGVGIPSYRDGAVHLDAVFASTAGESWTLVRKGRVRSVSILIHTAEFHRGVSGRLTKGELVAVDLVRTPGDERALIGEVVEGRKLTQGQRKAQRLLDAYLANSTNPNGMDLFSAVARQGLTAMDVLAPVVAPLRAERGGSAVAVSRGA